MGLEELIEISRKYGSDSDYVLAGGGNTSVKKEGILYVKASGYGLADIDEQGFARMSLEKLDRLWTKSYPQDKDAREEIVLKDMMDARCEGEEKRPSVEALLHSLLKGRYVVHTHPTLVNGLTCGRDGQKAMERLFGERALWVPLVDPGFILAKVIKDSIETALNRNKPYPSFIFLQNHGVFVAAETPDEIDKLYKEIFTKLRESVHCTPQDQSLPIELGLAESFTEALQKEAGAGYLCLSLNNGDIQDMVSSKKDFTPLSLPFSPDHIVYSGLEPLWLESVDDFPRVWESYEKKWNRPPKSAAIRKKGVFVFGDNSKALLAAKELFLDAVKVAVYTKSFGGPLPMTEESINFIANWEVEKYRAAQST